MSSEIFPARDILAEILNSLLQWERGDKSAARATLARAETQLDRLAPNPEVARTYRHVAYSSSVIWLEPILLLREARLKITLGPQAD